MSCRQSGNFDFTNLLLFVHRVEPVTVIEADGSTRTYPELAYREERVSANDLLKGVGIKESPERLAHLLSRMCLATTVEPDGETLRVRIPPTRHDILHVCDIVEDVAIAYGYDNIEQPVPQSYCVAIPYAINKLTDKLRQEMATAGFTECLTFSLVNIAIVFFSFSQSIIFHLPPRLPL